MDTYTFNLDPMKHQPSGVADFSKICNPAKCVVTYENSDEHIITKTEVIVEQGVKTSHYNLPTLQFNN